MTLCSSVPTRRLRWYVLYPERDTSGRRYKSAYMDKRTAKSYAYLFRGEVRQADVPFELPQWVKFWGSIVVGAAVFAWFAAETIWGSLWR